MVRDLWKEDYEAGHRPHAPKPRPPPAKWDIKGLASKQHLHQQQHKTTGGKRVDGGGAGDGSH
jgi:hypothetical protein